MKLAALAALCTAVTSRIILVNLEDKQDEESIKINLDDFGKQLYHNSLFDVAPGNDIDVSVTAWPNTGYRWYFTTNCGTILDEKSAGFKPIGNPKRGIGTQSWNFNLNEKLTKGFLSELGYSITCHVDFFVRKPSDTSEAKQMKTVYLRIAE